MSGTFVATPSRALTIEHEPTGRALTQFKPEEARSDLDKIEVLAAFGAKLRDDNKLRELAIAKIAVLVDIMDWWEHNVYAVGKNPGTQEVLDRRNGITQRLPRDNSRISAGQALETLGYAARSLPAVTRWRKMVASAKLDVDATVDRLVEGWKMRAGLLWKEAKPKKEIDYDLAVETIFRAYIKLDPDQRIELKQKIMDFEKSYKDPFAFKAA